MRRRQRLRTLLFIAVAVVATALGLIGYATNALRSLELRTVDTRFTIRGHRPPPKDLIAVKIDDVTFGELKLRPPFPRSVYGKAIDKIAPDRPKAIAYDVQFSEPTTDREDLALANSIANANGKVVLSTTEVNEKGEGNFAGHGGGKDLLQQLDTRFGNGNLPNDPGGVQRRVPYKVDKLKSLAVATAEVADRRTVRPFDPKTTWIDYYGPPNTVPSISFSKVVRGKARRGLFRNKIVVIGAYAPSLQDLHPTSTTGAEDLMTGPEIQANSIDTVRHGLGLTSAPGALNLLLIVVLGLAAPLANLRLRALRAFILAVAAGVLFTVAVQLAFNSGTVLSFVYAIVALTLAVVGSLGVHYVTAAFERERVRDLFSRFVPENVVGEVLQSADQDLRLGGVQREGTVMFTDLRGFTSFAESLSPDRVIQVLNHYLSGMSDAILNHGGTLVAYMGDGIMAVFGAPIAQPDHADRAVAAAREMLDERLPRFNEWLRSEGLSEDGFRMGIGLNSGSVMSGNVGSERRLEYTAIGDTTNTASRIEGMTKGTPHQLFLADSTRSFLKEEVPDLIRVGEFEVRGRQAGIILWSLADAASPGPEGAEAAAAASSGTS